METLELVERYINYNNGKVITLGDICTISGNLPYLRNIWSNCISIYYPYNNYILFK